MFRRETVDFLAKQGKWLKWFEYVLYVRRESFYEACEKSDIQKLYYPIVAALTAMKLVGAGKDMGLLDPSIGKSIAMFYIVAGSKTVPHHNQ